MNFLCNDCRFSFMFSSEFLRLPCSFCGSASSSEMDLMMKLLVISTSHESCGSDGVDHSQHDRACVS